MPTSPQPGAKTARDENFPVGSWLLPAALRPSIAAFYRVARHADDIADDPALSADDKLARLNALDEALAAGLELDEPGAGHARALLQAFARDAVRDQCRDWAELLAYCRLSAAPVGRFLLDLHGESEAAHPASDALCAALQILNHVQDCAQDRRHLGRSYIPADWLAGEGLTPDALAAPAASPALRRVLNRTLDGVDQLLGHARALPGLIRSARLRAEAAVIVEIASRLSALLRRRDPLAGTVKLSPLAYGRCVATGVVRAAWRAQPPKTSFYWAMRLLSRPQREAMFAIYAYCRELDDIADSHAAPEAKLARLGDWRDEVKALFDGCPATPAGRALLTPVRRFALDRAEFEELIRGMEMDVEGRMVAPDEPTLRTYCRRVAGSVGMLSIRVFGCTGSAGERFAVLLGEALQLTNILRDLDEDAAMGRLYLPREALAQAGINARDPDAVLRHPALPKVCASLAAAAEDRFTEAQAALAATHGAPLRPAVLMMKTYRVLLARLRRRGWPQTGPRTRLSGADLLWIALRHAVRA